MYYSGHPGAPAKQMAHAASLATELPTLAHNAYNKEPSLIMTVSIDQSPRTKFLKFARTLVLFPMLSLK